MVAPPASEQYAKEVLEIRYRFYKWWQDFKNANIYLVSFDDGAEKINLSYVVSNLPFLWNPKVCGSGGTLTPLGVKELVEGLNYFHQLQIHSMVLVLSYPLENEGSGRLLQRAQSLNHTAAVKRHTQSRKRFSPLRKRYF